MSNPRKLVLGADHGGFELKNALVTWLQEAGHQVTDYGTHTSESVDYPDFARQASIDVARGAADFGILVCTTGIGICMAANKVSGVRAAHLTSEHQAEMTRRHN
ncbi:MAG: RpiB/LacA/LacB family sugar-phosphate isomerase, partial [Verrucomicrobiota bacterium]